MSNGFKLGGDVGVAAGPVGAGTGAPITADMVVYVRAKGLYGGPNLSGSARAGRGARDRVGRTLAGTAVVRSGRRPFPADARRQPRVRARALGRARQR